MHDIVSGNKEIINSTDWNNKLDIEWIRLISTNARKL